MKRFLITIAWVLACVAPGFASSTAVDFTSPGIIFGPSFWSAGFKFQVNTAATVARLGVFDADQNGLSGTQQVGLWDSSGNLLASTLVNNSDSLEGYWRFHAITSVTLAAGQSYYVASQGGEAFSYQTYQTNGFIVNPYITSLQDSFVYNGHSLDSPLAFPTSTIRLSANQGGGFFGANLDFGESPAALAAPASIPEPASVVFLGAGLAALLLRQRNSRK